MCLFIRNDALRHTGTLVHGYAPGGTLIFSYIRRLGSFFWFKILNNDIFGVFLKNKYFLGMKILWILLWGHHKIGLYLGVISMHFTVDS